ncbi:MAG: WD40 repeat domain-containing protein, partial [Acidobacteria bacterium]|nr:WD40 repeat domain-containing protein [Acidobacteriota bacterium]
VISPNGKFVAAIDSASGSLALWQNGNSVESPIPDVKGISALASSPRGWRFGIGLHNGRVMTLPWPRSRQSEDPRTFKVPRVDVRAPVTALAFDSKGRDLAVATEDGNSGVAIHWLTGQDLTKKAVLPAPGLREINALAFSPTDSTLLVSVHHDSLITVWNLASREPVDSLRGHTGYVYAVAFHPKGHVFATGSKDRTVMVWNTATWRAADTLRDHSDNVYDVAFSPDGSLLLSAGRDGHVTVWDTNRWKHLADLHHHRGAVRTARFSTDGNTLLTASEDSTLIVWTRETGCDGCSQDELVAHAEARIEREDSLLRQSGGEYGPHSWETGGISRPSRR